MENKKQLKVLIERHHEQMSRFVIVPSHEIADWRLTETTVVEARVNKRELGRRALKYWDQDRWFIELPDKYCTANKLEVGGRIELEIERVSNDLPEELLEVLEGSAKARETWQSMSRSRQRMIRESVIGGKQKATRVRRAKAALCMLGQNSRTD